MLWAEVMLPVMANLSDMTCGQLLFLFAIWVYHQYHQHLMTLQLPEPTTGDTSSSVRISSPEVMAFSGRMDGWRVWYNSTKGALYATGFGKIMLDPALAARDPEKNKLLYALLAAATADGHASYYVTKFDTTMDGHKAWEELVDWFDNTRSRATYLARLRRELYQLVFHTSTTAEAFLKKFKTLVDNIRAIDRMLEYDTIDRLLTAIEHPDYKVTVRVLRGNIPLILEEAVEKIKERGSELSRQSEAGRAHHSYEHRLTQQHGDANLLDALDEGGNGTNDDDSVLEPRQQCWRVIGHQTTIHQVEQEAGNTFNSSDEGRDVSSVDSTDWEADISSNDSVTSMLPTTSDNKVPTPTHVWDWLERDINYLLLQEYDRKIANKEDVSDYPWPEGGSVESEVKTTHQKHTPASLPRTITYEQTELDLLQQDGDEDEERKKLPPAKKPKPDAQDDPLEIPRKRKGIRSHHTTNFDVLETPLKRARNKK